MGSVLIAARGLVFEAEPAPTRRAIAHFLPIAAAAIIASILHHPEIAIGVVFGSSVAVLSAVTGFVTLSGPLEHLSPSNRRVWPFLALSALLVFLLGFNGTFSPFDAALLLIQGVLAMLVWDDRRPREEGSAEAAPARRPVSMFGVFEVCVAVVIALIAAYAATRGAERFSQQDVRFPTSIMGATLFAVVLALPMVTTGVPAATAGRAQAAITAQIGVVFLNLNLLLPVLILLGTLNPFVRGKMAAATTTAAVEAPHAAVMVYPRVSWRIDAVAILILSLLMMAVADRRLKLSRGVSGALVVFYLAYLILVMYTSRWLG